MEERARLDGKKVLRVNCDETNLQRRQKHTAGLVLTPTNGSTPVLVNDDGHEKGSLTHLAFICDDSTIQAKLPQVVIVTSCHKLLQVAISCHMAEFCLKLTRYATSIHELPLALILL